LWECGCASGTIVGAAEARPPERLEQALLDKVHETQMLKTDSARVQS